LKQGGIETISNFSRGAKGNIWFEIEDCEFVASLRLPQFQTFSHDWWRVENIKSILWQRSPDITRLITIFTINYWRDLDCWLIIFEALETFESVVYVDNSQTDGRLINWSAGCCDNSRNDERFQSLSHQNNLTALGRDDWIWSEIGSVEMVQQILPNEWLLKCFWDNVKGDM
jgi:hypothetical protein